MCSRQGQPWMDPVPAHLWQALPGLYLGSCLGVRQLSVLCYLCSSGLREGRWEALEAPV